MLRTVPCARSDHFAVHFLAAQPAPARFRLSRLSRERQPTELSTGLPAVGDLPVDNLCSTALPDVASEGAPTVFAAWLGVVVPKRNAKRAVTRSLLKRQMRHAALRRIDAPAATGTAAVPPDLSFPAMADAAATASLRAGLWVVRLRAPFDRADYPSAASDALRVVVCAELDTVLQRAARKALSPGGRGSGGR